MSTASFRRAAVAMPLVLALALQCALAPPARAQEQGTRRVYHLAAAPLERSLLDIAADAGLALVYDPQLLAGATAAPVDGLLSPSEALVAALAGTGLALQWSDGARTLTLRHNDPTPALSRVGIEVGVGTGAPTAPLKPVGNGAPPTVNVNGARLPRVPPSVAVAADPQAAPTASYDVGGRELERQNVGALADLQQLVPGLNIAGSDASDIQLSIRGVGDGGGEPNIGMASSVAVYLDNVYLPRPGMLGGVLSDLEQVSVRPGVQGVLFGANATGGVLDLHTRAPTFTPEAALRVAAGRRGERQVRAMWSGPLSADVAGRLNLLHGGSDGDVRNLRDGARLNGTQETALRGQLLYRDGAALQLRLAADYGNSNATPTPVLAATNAVDGADAFLAQAAKAGAAVALGRVVDLDDENRVHVLQGGLSAEASLLSGMGYKLRCVTALRAFSYTPALADPLGVRLYADSGTAIAQRSWSQELRLDAPGGTEFDYAAGLSYLGQSVHTLAHTRYSAGVAGVFYDSVAYDGLDVVRYGSLRDASLAPFGAATWRPGRRWELKAGARLTYEEKSGRFSRLNRAPFDSGELQRQYWLPSANLSLQYRLDPAWRSYAALSYGEKSGGINVSAGAAKKAGYDSLLVAPEKTAGAELGLRGAAAGGAATLDVDLFWTEVREFQTQAYDARTLQTYLTNAGSFRSRGAEAKLRLAAGTHWQFDAAAVLNDARYRDYAQARCPAEVTLAPNPPASCDLSGARVFNTPKLTYNASARYTWRGVAALTSYVGARYAYRSWKFGSVDDSQFTRVPGYGLLALTAGIGGPAMGGRWDATLWLNNALDKRYYQQLSAGDYGAALGQTGAPRTLGASLAYQF